MKRILLGLCFFAGWTFGQSTLTSVQNGDFFAVGTWDCGLCVPQDGDTVIINHTINMNTGIPYTAGQIRINAAGSLNDGGNNKDMAVVLSIMEQCSVMDSGWTLDSFKIQDL